MLASLTTQRDLQARYRQQLYTNIYLLNLRHGFGQELGRMVNEDLFEKPNQTLFIHLSHYLITIIDSKRASVLSWPLLEKKNETTYRSQFVTFCSVHFKDGSLTPILSSHLVNAGGFKVVRLMFQLSELALRASVLKNCKKHSSHPPDGTKNINSCLELSSCQELIKSKISKKSSFTNKVKEIANTYKQYIKKIEAESKYKSNLLNNVVDGCDFFDESEKVSIKYIDKPSTVLEAWKNHIEERMSQIFKEWNCLEKTLLDTSEKCKNQTESIVMRHTLKDPASYTMEYKLDRDHIDTSNLEQHVSAHQKFILKTIVKDNTLIFSNLLKAYSVTLGFLFKNFKLSNRMNENLYVLTKNEENLDRVKEGMEALIFQTQSLYQQVKDNADSYQHSSCLNDEDLMEYNILNIPPLPRLIFKSAPYTDMCNMFTPIHTTKIHFNVGDYRPREDVSKLKTAFLPSFTLLQEKNMNLNEMRFKGETSKFLVPKPLSRPSTSKKNLNTTCMKPTFSTDQINRLLSTRKSFKKNVQNNSSVFHHQGIKRNRLFNETIESGSPLYKCYSSPNLNDITSDKYSKNVRHIVNSTCQVVTKDSPLHFDISGLQPISKDVSLEKSPIKEMNSDIPSIMVTELKSIVPVMPCTSITKPEELIIINDEKDDMISQIAETPKFEQKNETKSKTNSIERIINRYRKLREIKPQVIDYNNQKENDFNLVNMETCSPLPDLINPSSDSFIGLAVPTFDTGRKSTKNHHRESLGQALGVDATFLDDFDLIEF